MGVPPSHPRARLMSVLAGCSAQPERFVHPEVFVATDQATAMGGEAPMRGCSGPTAMSARLPAMFSHEPEDASLLLCRKTAPVEDTIQGTPLSVTETRLAPPLLGM